MKELQNFINFGIVGLGKTGIAAYTFLKKLDKNVICYDDNPNARENFTKLFNKSALHDILSEEWQKLDILIVSPGIPLNWPKPHYVATIAKKFNIPIISDIDLFYIYNSSKDYIAITGTNGKSTCTTLSYHIFQSNRLKWLACGNIGNAICDQSLELEGYILELSSFQLEITKHIKLSLALCLDIKNDHTDRYKDFNQYILAKERIFSYLSSKDYAILSIDSPAILNIYNNLTLPRKIAISTNIIKEGVITAISNKLIDNYFDHTTYDIGINKNLTGTHNQQNIAACYAIARAKNINSSNILSSIASYPGLPHRLQYIATDGNINFYNDSKATNNDSTQQALSSFSNIYWLAGGIAKSTSFEEFDPFLGNITKAYFFGRDKLLFTDYFKDRLVYNVCDNLQEALDIAYKDAKASNKKCTILLSPAAASLDQFKNFEERGQIFVNLVQSKL